MFKIKKNLFIAIIGILILSAFVIFVIFSQNSSSTTPKMVKNQTEYNELLEKVNKYKNGDTKVFKSHKDLVKAEQYLRDYKDLQRLFPSSTTAATDQ